MRLAVSTSGAEVGIECELAASNGRGRGRREEGGEGRVNIYAVRGVTGRE